jgi:hypothetical protein
VSTSPASALWDVVTTYGSNFALGDEHLMPIVCSLLDDVRRRMGDTLGQMAAFVEEWQRRVRISIFPFGLNSFDRIHRMESSKKIDSEQTRCVHLPCSFRNGEERTQ